MQSTPTPAPIPSTFESLKHKEHTTRVNATYEAYRSNPTDEVLGDLLESCRSAFRAQAHKKMRTLSLRKGEAYVTFDDMLQEVLMELPKAILGFRGDSSFYTYAYRIAHKKMYNIAKDLLEEDSIFLEFSEEIERFDGERETGVRGPNEIPRYMLDACKPQKQDLESPENLEGPSGAFLEMGQQVFGTLPPDGSGVRDRLIFGYRIEGLTYDQIAQLLNISTLTVKRHMAKMVEQLVTEKAAMKDRLRSRDAEYERLRPKRSNKESVEKYFRVENSEMILS